jgi:hypothetical protein
MYRDDGDSPLNKPGHVYVTCRKVGQVRDRGPEAREFLDHNFDRLIFRPYGPYGSRLPAPVFGLWPVPSRSPYQRFLIATRSHEVPKVQYGFSKPWPIPPFREGLFLSVTDLEDGAEISVEMRLTSGGVLIPSWRFKITHLCAA